MHLENSEAGYPACARRKLGELRCGSPKPRGEGGRESDCRDDPIIMRSMLRLGLGRWHRPGDLHAFFGTLEVGVLEALWKRGDGATVRDLQRDFPRTAYTTLMTTLDRLHRKGVLERLKTGRAFHYRPRYSRSELRLGLARNALGAILGTDASPRPLLSFLLEIGAQHDEALLDELERLVREKRTAAAEGDPGRRPR